MCCYPPTLASSQPRFQLSISLSKTPGFVCAAKRGKKRSIPGYRWAPNTSGDKTAAAQGHHVGRKLSHAGGAGQYVLNNLHNRRIHPNTSQAARSASYTALSTSDQANPWRCSTSTSKAATTTSARSNKKSPSSPPATPPMLPTTSTRLCAESSYGSSWNTWVEAHVWT